MVFVVCPLCTKFKLFYIQEKISDSGVRQFLKSTEIALNLLVWVLHLVVTDHESMSKKIHPGADSPYVTCKVEVWWSS